MRKKYTEKQRAEFAIGFANWLSNLKPSQKVSVWSKNGEYSGLFTMDNEQLLDMYTREMKNSVKFVNPNQEYPVTYTIKQDGTKVNEPTMVKGEDLTEPQIFELFIKELL